MSVSSNSVRFTGAADLQQLADFVSGARRLLVLTGAGCSAASGIPAYRDHAGRWAHAPPMQYREFLNGESTRRRYWAGSFAGWPRVAAATPNPAHAALARLERDGHVAHLVTQNVDGLHQRAGSAGVTELHGNLERVICLDCGRRHDRAAVQAQMQRDNPGWRSGAATRPDGDAAAIERDLEGFRAPACLACGGLLKPAVVFFGDVIPTQTAAAAAKEAETADALLVVGSSLMVFSGFRLVRQVAAAGKPVAAVNLGRTRADQFLDLKIEQDCGRTLPALAALLSGAEAT